MLVSVSSLTTQILYTNFVRKEKIVEYIIALNWIKNTFSIVKCYNEARACMKEN